ncbi:sterol desaturase family protein [Flavobacterium suncheonense]|uniref:Fatty acid hydroxylase n=1 Tax=Flavobacterium suncheonense GH29-5 = DSM 17707 TaxID=1121899 RepID=A0A0A2MDC5_9FLAO|nr:sterol desaturase family protein [Flavobacterium suncheonense]KGO90279.1 fatty acid hydroxylase [Flavobacterium suncheonense GH29-5 = DSM 17707]
MARKVVYNEGQARLFENKYLEMLTKGNPIVIWSMYIPILSYLVYRSLTVYQIPALTTFLLFFSGILYWTFFEYLAHRYIFHWVSENVKIQKVAYIMHGNHHEYPRDRDRLFMPPVPSLILSSTLFGLHYLLLGNYNWAFFPGFMFGYLLYASMHYAIHAFEPPFAFMKPLWRNHQMHHYRNEHLGFGVSNTFWDKVFGTTFDLRKHKEDPDKAKELKFNKE